MYQIIDGRGTGKTGRLMLLAKDTGAKIACANPYAMKEKARAYGITGIEIISYRDLMSMGTKHGKVYIDEMENFVEWCIAGNADLQGYCLSMED